LVEAFSIIAAIFTALQATSLIVLHLLPTDYNPVSDAVSDYGVGRYRGWFWSQALSGGLACLALGIALAGLHPFTPTQAVVALIVTAVSRFLIPFFATDQGGSRFQTLHGIIHMILAVLAFGGLIWAATGLWGTLKHYPAWHGPKASSPSSRGSCSGVSSLCYWRSEALGYTRFSGSSSGSSTFHRSLGCSSSRSNWHASQAESPPAYLVARRDPSG
jgi:Protein of unknown function (DUF998)